MTKQKRIEFDTEYGPIVIHCDPDVNIELLGVQRVIAKIGVAPYPTVSRTITDDRQYRYSTVTIDRRFPLIDD